MKIIVKLALISIFCFSPLYGSHKVNNKTEQTEQTENIKNNTLIKLHSELHCVEDLLKKYDTFFKLKDSEYRFKHEDLHLTIRDFENIKTDYNSLKDVLQSLQDSIDLFIEYDYAKIKNTIIELKKNEKSIKFKKNYVGPSAKELQLKFKNTWPLKEWSINNLNKSYREKYGKTLNEELNDLYSNSCLLKEIFNNPFYFIDKNTPDGARILEEWDKAFNELPRKDNGGTWGNLKISSVTSYGNGIDGIIAITNYLKNKVSQCYFN